MSTDKDKGNTGRYLLMVGDKELAILRMAMQQMRMPGGVKEFGWKDIGALDKKFRADMYDTDTSVNDLVLP